MQFIVRFLEKQSTVLRDVKRKLESLTKQLVESGSVNGSKSAQKAATLYQSCIDIVNSDKLKIKPLQEFLEKLKLPRLPALLFKPDESQESTNETATFDWLYTAAHMKRNTGIDKLIGFEVCMSICHMSFMRYESYTFIFPICVVV